MVFTFRKFALSLLSTFFLGQVTATAQQVKSADLSGSADLGAQVTPIDPEQTVKERLQNVVPAPDPAQGTGSITGNVTDANGGIIPGATVTLTGANESERQQTVTDNDGTFTFQGLHADATYFIAIHMGNFESWTSSAITLASDQSLSLPDVQLKSIGQQATVTVYANSTQVATEQVNLEMQQRVLGVIPNFYVVYDSADAAPLSAKLKFKLALRVSVDPVTVGGVAFLAAINQAADTPDYVQGAKGYGQRFGAVAANSFSDILIGGALLPSLLHQDPRYFYQGTGTTKSRLRHALLSPLICRGDNGKLQPNYSSVGGDLASSALSNLYYPESSRGTRMVFDTFAINTAERMLSTVVQEFVLPKLTSHAK